MIASSAEDGLEAKETSTLDKRRALLDLRKIKAVQYLPTFLTSFK